MSFLTPSFSLGSRADVPRILELANWAAAETTANFATEPEPLEQWLELFDRTHALHPWLVARDQGAIVGFAKSGPHKPRGAYRWSVDLSVYLDPAHHGRRIGSRLYELLLPTLKAQGYALAVAGITAGHLASERLHQAFGFTRVGVFHRIGFKFGQWHDVGYWELPLRQATGEAPSPVLPVAQVWRGA